MKLSEYFFLVADIETSTLYDNDGNPTMVWLSYGFCNLYDRDGYKVERCYYREWGELYDFFEKISMKFPNRKLICFVHNLGYEFDYFMKNLSKPAKFLTNSSHSPISATLEDFPQIEFRCTVKLTMQTLRKVGEQVDLPKLDSEYRFITPKDEITKEEIFYCERDCDIVAKYISDIALKEFGTFANLPLTKTGRVRKTYKKFYSDVANKNWDLYPPEDCYEALNRMFAGGVTISNPLFTGIVLYNVHSYDIKSSYPYAQLSEQYPYTIEKKEYEDGDMDAPFWGAKIKFNNIRSKYNWAWLSISKMDKFDTLTSEFFNGKLLYSDWCIRTITNVDYETIKASYDFDSIEVLEFYEMKEYGVIPEPYIDTIIKYSENKGMNKEIVKKLEDDGKKGTHEFVEANIQYMLSKNDFNAIYGMSVQKIVQQEYYIDEMYVWHKKDMEYKQKKGHMGRNFLFGVYVTAYARKNLITAIIKNCPNNFVYADTDSIKFIGDVDFVDTNKQLPNWCNEYKYLKGLGTFEPDGTYDEFVTYGAKKYSYTNDGVVYLTVAGLPKHERFDDKGKLLPLLYEKSGEIYDMKNITEFVPGIIFRKCKLGKKYITLSHSTITTDDPMEVVTQEETDAETLRFLRNNNIKTNGGVALYPVDYTLDITEFDKTIIRKTRKFFDVWISKNEELRQYIGKDLIQ